MKPCSKQLIRGVFFLFIGRGAKLAWTRANFLFRQGFQRNCAVVLSPNRAALGPASSAPPFRLPPGRACLPPTPTRRALNAFPSPNVVVSAPAATSRKPVLVSVIHAFVDPGEYPAY